MNAHTAHRWAQQARFKLTTDAALKERLEQAAQSLREYQQRHFNGRPMWFARLDATIRRAIEHEQAQQEADA